MDLIGLVVKTYGIVRNAGEVWCLISVFYFITMQTIAILSELLSYFRYPTRSTRKEGERTIDIEYRTFNIWQSVYNSQSGKMGMFAYLWDAKRDCWIRMFASAFRPATRHARWSSRVYVFSDVLDGARSFETTLLSAASTIPSAAFKPT